MGTEKPAVSEQRSPRSVDHPGSACSPARDPLVQISVAANVILGLGLLISLFTRPAGSQDPKAAVEALMENILLR